MKSILKSVILVSFNVIICSKINAQDTIVKLNGEQIVAKIIEISPSEIKYKRMENITGPMYTMQKKEAVLINYKNGMTDKFSEPRKSFNTIQPVTNAIPDTSARYIISLNDGTRLKGKLVSQNANEVVLVDNNIGQKTISRKKINSMELQYGRGIMVVTLNDGSIISGKILNQTESFTVIETQDLGLITLSASKIKQIKEFEDATVSKAGNIWFKNPNSTRYLFAPSAYQLKKGEGYYQNIYGAGNAFNYGVTNYATIGGGLVGPMGVYLNAKVGGEVAKNVNVACGALVGNSFFQLDNHNFGLGIGFGVVTIGNFDHNLTFGAGYGIMDNANGTDWMTKPLYTVNGMARVGRKFALVTENWIVNVKGNPFGRDNISSKDEHYETFFSYAFRYMGQRSTLDAGFVNTPGLIEQGWYIGIPYIGFVVRFGKYKDE